jgi:hypothetical protein
MQDGGKAVDIPHLDMLVCRKVCVQAEHMDIGTGWANK